MIVTLVVASGPVVADPLPTIATFEMKKARDERRAAARDPKGFWIQQIVARIDARKPRFAKPLKAALKVEIGFVVARDGHLVSKVVATSSGSAEIDAVALAMVEHAAPFPPMPAAVGDQQLSFDLPVRFR